MNRIKNLFIRRRIRKAQAVAAQQERIERNREDMKFGRWYE